MSITNTLKVGKSWNTPCVDCGRNGPRLNKWNPCIDCQSKKETERQRKKQKLLHPSEEENKAINQTAFQMGIEIEEEAEPEPQGLQYPQLRFPYEVIPQNSILKTLTDKACEGGLSPGLVVPAILTIVSAIPRCHVMDGARINMDTTLMALVGAGKDTAIERALAVTGVTEDLHAQDYYTEYSPSGERSISNLLGDRPSSSKDPPPTTNTRPTDPCDYYL